MSDDFNKGDLVITCTATNGLPSRFDDKLGIIERVVASKLSFGSVNYTVTKYVVFLFEGPHNTSSDDGCWFFSPKELKISNNSERFHDE